MRHLGPITDEEVHAGVLELEVHVLYSTFTNRGAQDAVEPGSAGSAAALGLGLVSEILVSCSCMRCWYALRRAFLKKSFMSCVYKLSKYVSQRYGAGSFTSYISLVSMSKADVIMN